MKYASFAMFFLTVIVTFTFCNVKKDRNIKIEKSSSETVVTTVTYNEQFKSAKIKSSHKDITKWDFIAIEDKEVCKRLEALGHVTNDAVLTYIVTNDPDLPVRLKALEKIKNQSILQSIANNDTCVDMRKVALLMLKD